MVGHYERIVRIIKVCPSTAIAKKLFNYEEFVTVIRETKNIINSRPLRYQGTDTADIPLSLSQLVWGCDLTLMPPLLQSEEYAEINFEAKAAQQQYELVSQALDHFKRRWNSGYLTALREKHNNRCADKPTHHLEPGCLVMVRRDDMHCLEWPLGKITRVLPDPNGVTHTVEVERAKRSTCSVTFIVPLELGCEGTEAIPQAEEGEEVAEMIQSPVLNDMENGEENETTEQQRELYESSHSSNIEGGGLQHSGTPPEPTQTPSS